MNMPISEDELDNRHTALNNEPSSTMSKAELRKTHKPIMEKRRRARINQCLNEIKTLILEAMKKDPARHSKLEKADILEMAVKHLQNVQRQQLAMAIAGDPTVLRRFKTGFEECARQVSTYIDQIDPDEDATTTTTTTTTQNSNYNGLKGRIAEHLAKCMGGIEHIARFNLGAGGFSFFPTPINTATNSTASTDPITSARSAPTTDYNSEENVRPSIVDDDLNNNPPVIRQQSQSILHLIPSRLPTGELAFLVPNSNNLSKLSRLLLNANNNNSRQYSRGNNNNSDLFSTVSDDSKRHHSAFVAVTPSSATNEQVSRSLSTISPPLSPADEDVVTSQHSLSPERGFRPFNSALQKSYRSAFLSTAKLGAVDLKVDTDQKSVEPLCIITNQSERFKRAQILANSVNCEENRRRLKREYSNAEQDYAANVELSHSSHGGGLLIVSGNNNQHEHRPKIMKTSKDNSHPSQPSRPPRFNYNVRDASMNIESRSSQFNTSKESGSDNGVDNSDMWRPW